MTPWTNRQRAAVIGLIGLILAVAAGRLAFNHSYIADPQPTHPARENELADRIDPNTADAASLSVLPLIGEKRAEDIIRYREKYVAGHPGQVAFKQANDLLLIRGIGQTTVMQLSPYLVFPGSAATRPLSEKP